MTAARLPRTACLAWLLLASAAQSATFTVDADWDDRDAAPGDGICATAAGRCTLRAAVQESNGHAGPDVIRVPARTYRLDIPGANEDLSASGDLDVLDAVTIRAAGAGVTIVDAMAIDRCLDVIGCSCDVSGLTLRGGSTPDDDSVRGGAGIAVRDGASVTALECQVSDNVGLIGAGIAVGTGGVVTLDRTTIDGNWCYQDNEGQGGALFADVGAILVLENTTVSGNRSDCGGGIASASASVTLRNCTVTDNHSGGVCDSGALFGRGFELANTILAGNHGPSAYPDCVGEIASLGYNVLGDLSPIQCVLTGDMTGNIIGLPPRLGPLADNGGPAPTHALLAGSPAIDGGNPLAPGSAGVACEPQDERGLLRPQDGDMNGASTCDIGALELGFETGRCTNRLDDDGDALADCSDPDCCADPACAFMPETECCDGIDNDCDGDIDLLDSNCSNAPDCYEWNCTDGVDDDGDWLIDCFDEDCCARPACLVPETRCCDGIDNDCDGLTDHADPDCALVPPCTELDCADGADDDLDALIDCADPDCRGTPPCDDDGDGVANGMDCAPDDAGAFSAPREVPRLDVHRFDPARPDFVVLTWTDLRGAAGPGLVADVLEGGIAQLRAERGLSGAACLAGDVGASQALDLRVLGVTSDGFWYLVRAENACGVGPLGSDSAGVPRDIGGVSCP